MYDIKNIDKSKQFKKITRDMLDNLKDNNHKIEYLQNMLKDSMTHYEGLKFGTATLTFFVYLEIILDYIDLLQDDTVNKFLDKVYKNLDDIYYEIKMFDMDTKDYALSQLIQFKKMYEDKILKEPYQIPNIIYI